MHKVIGLRDSAGKAAGGSPVPTRADGAGAGEGPERRKGAARIQPRRGLRVQCSVLTPRGRSDPPAGQHQPHKGRGGNLASRTAPRQTRAPGPGKPSGVGPSALPRPGRKAGHLRGSLPAPGRGGAWSSGLAGRLRKAARRLRPVSPGRTEPGRDGALRHPPPRPGDPGPAPASSRSRRLPGGGAAPRASIRERRGAGPARGGSGI